MNSSRTDHPDLTKWFAVRFTRTRHACSTPVLPLYANLEGPCDRPDRQPTIFSTHFAHFFYFIFFRRCECCRRPFNIELHFPKMVAQGCVFGLIHFRKKRCKFALVCPGFPLRVFVVFAWPFSSSRVVVGKVMSRKESAIGFLENFFFTEKENRM